MPDPRAYYHLTMQPRRRLPVLHPEVEAVVRQVLEEMTAESAFTVLEVGVVPTHVHVLLEKAPWADLLPFVREFQDRSSERILSRFPELIRDMQTERFWTDGSFHYRRHTAASLETVRRYVREQKRHHGLE